MRSTNSCLPRLTLIIGVLCIGLISTPAHATFSIVAVDTITGAVGGAGASCIDGSVIINDIIESVGAVHTQAYYLAGNQNNAHNLLLQGLTPDSIIAWLAANDIEGEPGIRQYGVVTLAGPGSSAAYTGDMTTYWAGHVTGPGYAIQGNILLGEQIINDMETAYLNTEGPLEDRLMAALQAANVTGADTRCMASGKPALSAFIKVVHPGDGPTPFLFLNVNSAPGTVNPIDRLQTLYDQWKLLTLADPELSTVTMTPPYLPASSGLDSATITVVPRNLNGDPPTYGAEVALLHTGPGTLTPVTDNGDGTFTAYIVAPAIPGKDTVIADVTAGGQTITLNDKPGVQYYKWGDANGDGAVNVGDAVFIIIYVFKGGQPPVPLAAGDANCDGLTNVGDAVFVIIFVFQGGPEPHCP